MHYSLRVQSVGHDFVLPPPSAGIFFSIPFRMGSKLNLNDFFLIACIIGAAGFFFCIVRINDLSRQLKRIKEHLKIEDIPSPPPVQRQSLLVASPIITPPPGTQPVVAQAPEPAEPPQPIPMPPPNPAPPPPSPHPLG